MRIGIFWLGNLEPRIAMFCSEIFEQNYQDASFSLYSNKTIKCCHTIEQKEKSYKYDEINALCDVYSNALSDDVDFALISYGSSFPMSPPAIIDLLSITAKKGVIWSFRHSEVSGVGMRHSARLPYVDENFIILNVKEAKNKSFFDRRLINSIHFYHTSGINSVLQSMFEYSLDCSEYSNHYIEEFGKNQYGECSKLKSFPFFLCEKYMFLTCYPEYSSRIRKLLLRNIEIILSKDLTSDNKLKLSSDFYYLTKIFNFSKIFLYIKSFFRPDNLSFKKSYKEK